MMEEHRSGEKTENIRLLGTQGKSHTQQEGEGALLDLGGEKKDRIWQRETVCSNKACSISSYQQNCWQNSCQKSLIYAFYFHCLIRLQLAEHCSEQRDETLLKLVPCKVKRYYLPKEGNKKINRGS